MLKNLMKRVHLEYRRTILKKCLIGGNSMEYGYDEDEIIIKNAEVIAGK